MRQAIANQFNKLKVGAGNLASSTYTSAVKKVTGSYDSVKGGVGGMAGRVGTAGSAAMSGFKKNSANSSNVGPMQVSPMKDRLKAGFNAAKSVDPGLTNGVVGAAAGMAAGGAYGAVSSDTSVLGGMAMGAGVAAGGYAGARKIHNSLYKG